MHPYTQSLMSAVPIPEPEVEKSRSRILLKGDVPSPANPPPGCVFSTRCPFATERCRREVPQPRQLRPGHTVACHNVDDPAVGEEIRLSGHKIVTSLHNAASSGPDRVFASASTGSAS